MELDARPGPAGAAPSPAVDEVVAEYELVLCEPAGGPDTEVRSFIGPEPERERGMEVDRSASQQNFTHDQTKKKN
jgi:hypothetical protein